MVWFIQSVLPGCRFEIKPRVGALRFRIRDMSTFCISINGRVGDAPGDAMDRSRGVHIAQLVSLNRKTVPLCWT